MIHATEGLSMAKMMPRDNVEVSLESFERAAKLTG